MKKSLKIAQLAPPWLRTPPKKYGGTELIVALLCEGLVKKGHQVTLFASGNSKTSAKLISVFQKPLYWQNIRWSDPYYPLLHSLAAFERQENFDIVHNHFDFFGLALAPFFKKPFLTTFHRDFSNIQKNSARYLILKKAKNSVFVSISNSQRKFAPLKLNFTATIYNGIETEKFEFDAEPGGYLSFLGRITPKKGVLEAITIAKKSGMPLKIAAKIDKNCPTDIEFYQKKIKPLIDGKKIVYIGEIGGEKAKSSFLKNSFALLHTINFNEPFGLVMAEAMACGTPVIVFDKGSAREIVKHGETGFIVKNIGQAASAVKKIGEIKRRECRSWVEKNFSDEKMIAEYEKLYYKILEKRSKN